MLHAGLPHLSRARADDAQPSFKQLPPAGTLPALGEAGLSVELLEVGPCAAVAPHSHPNGHQLVYVQSGSFVHSQWAGGALRRHLLGQGEVSATPLGERLTGEPDG